MAYHLPFFASKLISSHQKNQVPEVESLEADLLSTVPPSSDPVSLYKQLKAHDELTDGALDACRKMKETVDDREFHWKARITADEDEEDEDEEAKDIPPPRYTLADLGRFMRDGTR